MYDNDSIEISLREEQIRKEVRMECKIKDGRELILDHIWTLLQYLEDDTNPDLVASVLFFVSRYELDPDELPRKLGRIVRHHLEESAEEASYDAESVLADHLNRALECLDCS